MSFEQNIGQQFILTKFFEYIRSEDFEQCFHCCRLPNMLANVLGATISSQHKGQESSCGLR